MVDRISGDGLQKTDASYSNRRKKRDSGVWKSAYILSSAWDMREQGLVALDLHQPTRNARLENCGPDPSENFG